MGKNLVPAPWATLPPAWSLDDTVVDTAMPSTADLVPALLQPEDKGGDLAVCLAFTTPLHRHRIFDLIVDRGRDAPEPDLFADVADALTAAAIGWRRWEATHVWTHTIGAWHVIDGEHLARGVDLMSLPAGRATSTAFAWWRQTLGRQDDEWKRWVKDMKRKPRRVIRREAAKPMDPRDVAQLQGLIGQATGTRSAVAASTIRMPDQIP